jgi:HD-like signal output (HDOD) protein
MHLPAPEDGIEVEEAKRLLRALFASPGYRAPVLSHVAVELMQLSQRPHVQFAEVVRLLEQDPVLAARALSMAQSAFYAPRSPILSLHQAVVRLGLKALRELVLEAALHLKIFRVPGFEAPMARLARHSTATAHVVRAVCRRTLVDAEYAFLCGLLHDVGIAGILLALAEDPRWKGVSFEELTPVLEEVHAEASGILCRVWKLAEAIQDVVANHHDVTVDGRAEPVRAALVVAEQLVWEAGAGMLPPPEDADPMSPAMPEPPLEGLDANWTGVVEEARKVLNIDALAFCAARAEAFEIVRRLGPAGGRAPAAAPRPATAQPVCRR